MMTREEAKEIKMIVSDIDGTILPYKERIMPQEIFGLISQLHEKGIHFMIASGRDAESIRELFAPVKDKIGCISGNGAIYAEGMETVFTQSCDQTYIRSFLDFLTEDSNLMPVIMTEKNYYLVIRETKEEVQTKRELAKRKFGRAYIEVRSPYDIPEEICKIGIFQKRLLDEEEVRILRDRWSQLAIVCGGGPWLDVTQQGVNKGSAINRILETYQLHTNNLMSFGDNENDVEMLALAKYGYAVSSATSHAKRAASFECDTVAEVLQELLTYLEQV